MHSVRLSHDDKQLLAFPVVTDYNPNEAWPRLLTSLRRQTALVIALTRLVHSSRTITLQSLVKERRTTFALFPPPHADFIVYRIFCSKRFFHRSVEQQGFNCLH
mmetsp:Transcript_7706/g.18820  ORF Transcript_7706/g.18820 Transcript_7706/m.18820 type:complete len:104 (-) Transcript_7706:825-1136(-)